MENIVKDKIAFEKETGGLTFRAWYLAEPKGDCLVEITKGDALVRRFLWPAYKIWNIAAHASEIAESELAGDLEGYGCAGSDGLGGGVAPREV